MILGDSVGHTHDLSENSHTLSSDYPHSLVVPKFYIFITMMYIECCHCMWPIKFIPATANFSRARPVLRI